MVINVAGKGLDDEIVRLGDNYWNYVEGIKIGKVKSVGTTTAEVYIDQLNLTIPDAPIMQPNYGTHVVITNAPAGMTLDVHSNLNITVGTQVYIAFINGQSTSPLIIGVV